MAAASGVRAGASDDEAPAAPSPGDASGPSLSALLTLGVLVVAGAMLVVAFGAALPQMRGAYEVDDSAMGLALLAAYVGGCAGLLAATLIAVRVDAAPAAGGAQWRIARWARADTNRVLLSAGALVATTASWLQWLVPVERRTFGVLVFVMFSCAVANSLVGVGSTCITAAWGRVATGATTGLHFSFGIGAVATPLLIGALHRYNDWFLVTGLFSLCALVVAVRAHFRAAAPPSASPGGVPEPLTVAVVPAAHGAHGRRARELVRTPAVWHMGALLFLYMGVEQGIVVWVSSFMTDAGIGALATLSTSLFWAGELAGRALLVVLNLRYGRVADDASRVRVLRGSMAGAALFGALLVAISPSAASLALVWLAGLACAPFFPLLMTVASARYAFADADGPLLVITLLSLCANVGGGTLMAAQGALADALGVRASLAVSPVCAALTLALLRWLRPAAAAAAAAATTSATTAEMYGDDVRLADSDADADGGAAS